jgi:hypothetical protein
MVSRSLELHAVSGAGARWSRGPASSREVSLSRWRDANALHDRIAHMIDLDGSTHTTQLVSPPNSLSRYSTLGPMRFAKHWAAASNLYTAVTV